MTTPNGDSVLYGGGGGVGCPTTPLYCSTVMQMEVGDWVGDPEFVHVFS